MVRFFVYCFVLMTFATGCKQNKKHNSLERTVKSDSLELVSEGISTLLYERDFTIHPSGKWILFSRGNFDQSQMGIVLYESESKQEIASISGVYRDIEPFFSPNGEMLFFASNRPFPGRPESKDYNIWSVPFNAELGTFGEVVPLPEIINTTGDEFYPSVTQSGNMYFTADYKGISQKEDIWLSKWMNGKYQQPELLPAEINTAFYEFNAFVAPDESFILYSVYGKPNTPGGGDIWINRKSADGKWLSAEILPQPINSSALDYCPFVDIPNGVLYFSSNRKATKSNSGFTLKSLKEQATRPINGFGDIYRIRFQ
ncbi:exo-alpha-sialidase [bacterium]|nr:MAG: exo-alpha-sialidase [bacterium]